MSTQASRPASFSIQVQGLLQIKFQIFSPFLSSFTLKLSGSTKNTENASHAFDFTQI